MKRAVLLLFLMGVFAGAAAFEFGERLARFHEHYDRFVRAYMGCPKGAVYIEECKAAVAAFPYGEFNKAAHDARDLFCFDKDQK